jgi:hypothetical protein
MMIATTFHHWKVPSRQSSIAAKFHGVDFTHKLGGSPHIFKSKHVGRNIHRRKSPSKNTGRNVSRSTTKNSSKNGGKNASENARRIKFTSQSKFSC